MLEVVTAYKTSKGIFLFLSEALKNKNRHYDARDNAYEEPSPIFLLRYGNSFFALNSVDINLNNNS